MNAPYATGATHRPGVLSRCVANGEGSTGPLSPNRRTGIQSASPWREHRAIMQQQRSRATMQRGWGRRETWTGDKVPSRGDRELEVLDLMAVTGEGNALSGAKNNWRRLSSSLDLMTTAVLSPTLFRVPWRMNALRSFMSLHTEVYG